MQGNPLSVVFLSDDTPSVREQLVSLVAEVIFEYGEFATWRDELEYAWSKDPPSYSRDVHMQVRRIGDRWHDLHRRIVRLLDWFEATGEVCPKGAEIRKRLRSMASIEIMDSTESLPEHLQSLARKAIEEYHGAS